MVLYMLADMQWTHMLAVMQWTHMWWVYMQWAYMLYMRWAYMRDISHLFPNMPEYVLWMDM
jgi:hypothetical protein